MDTDETQTDPQEAPPGRRWWQRKPKPPPDPAIHLVMAQWGEYELIFNDILTRLNAQLARQAKMQKRALERIKLEGEPEPQIGAHPEGPPPVLQSSKQQLRTAWAAQRYGGILQSLTNSKEARE